MIFGKFQKPNITITQTEIQIWKILGGYYANGEKCRNVTSNIVQRGTARRERKMTSVINVDLAQEKSQV